VNPKLVRPSGDHFQLVLPPGAVYIGRHGPHLKWSLFYNPLPVAKHGLAMSRDRIRRHVTLHPELVERARVELASRDLACWCPLDVGLASRRRSDHDSQRRESRRCAVISRLIGHALVVLC
jgi:hypothetical protein